MSILTLSFHFFFNPPRPIYAAWLELLYSISFVNDFFNNRALLSSCIEQPTVLATVFCVCVCGGGYSPFVQQLN